MRGALTGAALGAAGGAYWGTTIGESGAVPIASTMMAGVGALSGSITGIAVAALPRKGWKRNLLAIGTGALASGLIFTATEAIVGGPSTGTRFESWGVVHGAATGFIVTMVVD